jgi:MerR family transcriptional regulator, redox-sensitive transcriptional activator SoxR
MHQATLTIGQVAQQVGVKTSAIRYYEAVGVLPEPERRGGQRRYTDETIQRLHVIDIAKRAGFSLDEAKMLLATTDGGAPAYAQLRELAMRKLPEVDALIARATAVREWLNTATGCNCETLDVCGLFEVGAKAPDQPDAAAPGGLELTHVEPDLALESDASDRTRTGDLRRDRPAF